MTSTYFFYPKLLEINWKGPKFRKIILDLKFFDYFKDQEKSDGVKRPQKVIYKLSIQFLSFKTLNSSYWVTNENCTSEIYISTYSMSHTVSGYNRGGVK